MIREEEGRKAGKLKYYYYFSSAQKSRHVTSWLQKCNFRHD